MLRYPPDHSGFYAELKRRISAYFREQEISEKANSVYFIKITILILLFGLIYSCVYIFQNTGVLYLSYSMLGVLCVMLGINIGHDAVHGAVFKQRKNNARLVMVFELFGLSSFNWKNRHLGAHHLFPNVKDHDSDVQQSTIVRIFPADKFRFFHRFQHYYMPLLYMIYLLRWIVYRDLKDVFSRKIGAFDNSFFPLKEIVSMFFFKLLFGFNMITLPVIFTQHTFFEVAGAFLCFTISGSIFLTLILLSTHVGEDARFPEPDADGNLPFSWAVHQVETTTDFAPRSFLFTHMTGGFNHHVIHHLFPSVCHIHYPKLTPILRAVANEFHLPYKCTDNVFKAVGSHFTLLKRNARQGKQVIEFSDL